jgi:hypothetical protein
VILLVKNKSSKGKSVSNNNNPWKRKFLIAELAALGYVGGPEWTNKQYIQAITMAIDELPLNVSLDTELPDSFMTIVMPAGVSRGMSLTDKSDVHWGAMKANATGIAVKFELLPNMDTKKSNSYELSLLNKVGGLAEREFREFDKVRGLEVKEAKAIAKQNGWNWS